MDSNKIEALKEALIEVRKAHRLVYSFQERMLSLMKFISARLDLPEFSGVKHYSAPIKKFQGRDELEIWNGMWAWDYLYSYVFEYFLGGKTLEDGSRFNLSVVQYADTGFFDSDTNDRRDISSFVDPSVASSKLLFIMEHIPKGKKDYWTEWDTLREYIEDRKYASSKHKSSILYPKGPDKSCLVFYSIPLERFVDEHSSIEALKEYQSYLRRKGISIELV